MQIHDIALPGVVLALLLLLAPPLGGLIARIFAGEIPKPLRPLVGLERFVLRVAGIDGERRMNWKQYAGALLAFNLLGILFMSTLLLTQHLLPMNPQGMGAMRLDTVVNTAVSFVTNTNWQSYSGDAALSYLSQSLGCVVQNFLSAATGISVVAALARGFAGRTTSDLGNFWKDLTRAVVYVLLPLSVVSAVFLVSQGVVQNFAPYVTATTVEGAQQILPMGPAAGQVAIKMIGTNGGGFFGANGSHPFENPNALTNLWSIVAMLLIPASLPFTFGALLKDRRQGFSIFAAMLALFLLLAGTMLWAEHSGASHAVANSLMEGKETRFGVTASSLFATSTSVTSCGAVNAEMSSLSPLGGGVAIVNIMLGEVVFGGVGSGLYGMVVFAIITVFIAGLMVGRTPEYLGKKIEAFDIRMAMIIVIAPCVALLTLAAIACHNTSWAAGGLHSGPHGLTEILYAFTSMANNNGSAFAGVAYDNAFCNYLGTAAMLIGRFVPMVAVLALAGNLAAKRVTPPSSGTFPTHGFLFVALLVSIVLIVGALTFFPALTLGPVLEHLLMNAGRAL
jgi:K+-transporting ATPase ATPase A chain